MEVTDLNGCLTRDTLTVFENFEAPFFSSTVEEIDCITGMGSISLISDSSYLVTWTLPDGSNENGNTISSNQQGDYIVIATNSIGCESTDTISLTANQDFPIVNIAANDINCALSVSTVFAESNVANTLFSWVGPNGFTSNENEFTSEVAGTYIYTATSPQGCSTSDTVFVLGDFEEPDLTLSVLDTFDCNTSEIEVEISSSADFTISQVISSNLISTLDNIISVGESSQLVVEITGTNGCSSMDTIVLTSDFQKPETPIIQDLTLDCNLPDTLIELNPSNDFLTIWSDGTNTEMSNNYLINSEGSYTLTIVNPANGCDSSTTFNVLSHFDAEVPTINASAIDCNEIQATINLNTSQEIAFSESFSDVTQLNINTFTSTTAGQKDFIVTYENGCSVEISTIIEVDTLSPEVSSSDYAFSCMKEPLIIVVDHNVENPTFMWEAPDGFETTEEVLFTAIPGLYMVTVTNSDNGCSSALTIPVEENSTSIEAEIDAISPQCFGELGTIDVKTIGGGTEPYSLSFHDSIGNAVENTSLLGGQYTIIIEDYFGCDTSITVEIDDVYPFSADAGSSNTIVSGETYDLEGNTDLDTGELLNIEWSPEELLSCNDCLNPIASDLENDTWFTLSITDTNGCVETDSVLIRVLIDYNLYTPNAFSPNNDGKNDVFTIFSNSAGATTKISEFRIYDRWGNKKGDLNGSPASQGVYSYYFKALYPDNSEEIISGTVTILR